MEGSVKDSFFSVLNGVYLSGQLKTIMTMIKSSFYQYILGLESVKHIIPMGVMQDYSPLCIEMTKKNGSSE